MPSSTPLTIETVEMHTGGEPVRIVVAGYPPIEGATLLAKRRQARERLDAFRRLLMFEPRGHFDMYGVIPVAPDPPKSGEPPADLAVLFMHNEGYSTVCGHAVIALGRWAVDSGRVPLRSPETPVAIQCPCGLVRARVSIENGKAGAVAFESVPAFAFALDAAVEVPGAGRVALDIGYGGAFYAVLSAARFGLDVRASPTRALVDADGADAWSERQTANICVFAAREVDRSPTGSGVTARLALQHARRQIQLGQSRKFESITGAIFSGKVLRETSCGNHPAVTVEVSGKAHYTGTARFTLEEDDEIGKGFLLK